MATKRVVLAFDIWHDIQRYFLVYLLLLMVVASAFSVIYLTHLNRQTTVQLENLLTERDELDVEWRNLLLEQNSLAEHSAIESKATNKLQMKRPSVDSEVIVTIK
ncbi:MAG: cell division protein FtsL [Thalassotalea sp.]